jgi:hypothetical protein
MALFFLSRSNSSRIILDVDLFDSASFLLWEFRARMRSLRFQRFHHAMILKRVAVHSHVTLFRILRWYGR